MGTQMKSMKIQVNNDDFGAAEQAAREAVTKQIAAPNLLAFFDRKADVAAPSETCDKEGRRCPAQYAANHGADLKVMVNGNDYEFYYTATPKDARVLDPEQVIAIHRDLVQNRVDNLQGG